MDDLRPSRWLGFAFDATIIVSLTVLTALRVVPVLAYVALLGPLVGSRLSLRYLRDGGSSPEHGAGGSVTLGLLLAFSWAARRAFGLG